MEIELVNFPPEYNGIAARGTCPHCGLNSYFRPLCNISESGRSESGQLVDRIVTSARCEACKRYVLIIGFRGPNSSGYPFALESFYPQGKPEHSVPSEVPDDVADDFAEALRCQWIDAHKACVVMCRRALQTSAITLGAKGNRLIDQIDNLASSGTITNPLKEFAHQIRLTGNDGAHPDKDGLNEITEEDSKAIIEFTWEYLHHVYVMPAKLKARQAKIAASAPTNP